MKKDLIQDQAQIVQQHFPKLTTIAPLPSVSAPAGLSWYAIPRWQKVGKTYNQAVERILAVLGNTRDFYNWREGQLGPKHLRRLSRADEFLSKFGTEDIIFILVQTGEKHKGKSVQEVRAGYEASELGLGAFEVAAILLTHPERLTKWEDLWIDCPGDEFDVADDVVRWSRAPFFYFGGDGLKFDASGVGLAFGFYGSASAFSPQYPNLESQTLDFSGARLTLEIRGEKYEAELTKSTLTS